MATAFVFVSAPLNNLSTGTYCVFPVSSIPSANDTIAANVSAINGFAPVILQNRQLLATGLVFDSFQYPFFNYTVDTVGYCVARLVGSSPSPNDQLVCFNGYSNALDQDIVTPPGSFSNSFTVDPAKGVLQLIPAYRYTSGNLAVPAVNALANGSIYLAGTRNNTVAWAAVTDRVFVWRAVDGANAGDLYDRVLNTAGTPDHILDMRQSRIRVEDILMRTSANSLNNVTWWGSNSIAEGELTSANTNSIYNNNARWTQLTAAVNLPASQWTKVTTNDRITFWGHLKMNSANTNNSVQEIEFGRSTWQSPKANMVP